MRVASWQWAAGSRASGCCRLSNSDFILFVILVLLVNGCGSASNMQSKTSSEVDLTELFSPVTAKASSGSLDRHLPVVRKGQRRDSMILVAPITISASLQSLSGTVTVKGLATPVFNIGDGMQLDLYLMHGGTRRLVGSRYFDSARRAEDRDWIPIAIPLELGGAKDDQLEIQLSAGPQGDLVADWLALSSLRLVQGAAIR